MTSKKKSTKRKSSRSARSTKSAEQLRKEAIADADANIARVDGTPEVPKATQPSNAKGTKGQRKAKTIAGADTLQPRTAKAKSGTKAGKSSKATKSRKLSGLDHAAKVLADSKEPLNAKTIAERAIAGGWVTNGATPHATLYAAMIREIATKGAEARFKKTERGIFTSTGRGA